MKAFKASPKIYVQSRKETTKCLSVMPKARGFNMSVIRKISIKHHKFLMMINLATKVEHVGLSGINGAPMMAIIICWRCIIAHMRACLDQMEKLLLSVYFLS